MILSTSTSLLATSSERQFNSYDENSNNTTKDLKNSVNSSSSASLCSSSSPTRPLSSCSPLSTVDTSFSVTNQTCLQSKKSSFIQQTNRYHPYYNANGKKHTSSQVTQPDMTTMNPVSYTNDLLLANNTYNEYSTQQPFAYEYDYSYQNHQGAFIQSSQSYENPTNNPSYAQNYYQSYSSLSYPNGLSHPMTEGKYYLEPLQGVGNF